MNLGIQIKEARTTLGLTQEALAEGLGIAPQTVSKWERGESLPDAALLPGLADALHMSLDRLFERKAGSWEDAVAALQAMGLIVRIEYGSSDRVNIGDVIKQSISSGTEVSIGTEIILTVNNPSMIGQSETAGGGASIQTASWTTNSTLDAPSNYQGGAFRLVLQQNVNGETVETTVDEGDYMEFPYQLLCKGAAGVPEGKVVMYELYDGDYISRASWPVTFSSAG